MKHSTRRSRNQAGEGEGGRLPEGSPGVGSAGGQRGGGRSRPRAHGRRGAAPGHDSPETRERLLAAGRSLFALRGFEGTSVRAITAQAGVNLGAVTYHFESKEGLYRAVLKECFGPLRDRLEMVKRLPIAPLERVEVVVRGMFQHLLGYPDMPRFMVQELVVGEVPAGEVVRLVRSVLETIAGFVEEGHNDGSIVPGDPVLQALTIMSQPIYLSVVPAFLKRSDLRDEKLPLPQRSPENHAIAVLRRALLAGEEEEEGGVQ